MHTKKLMYITTIFVLVLSLALSACGPDDDIADAGKANGKEKVTICHKTGNPSKPYKEMSVSESALNGHKNHKEDIIPAPADGCP
jgi:uncharacterized lipoprotein YehR (DUF1307 family)